MIEVLKLKELMKSMKCNKIDEIDFSKIGLENLFSLFDLTSTTITLQDVKKAKAITNKTHPDKSGLASEYFIFYKSAFLIILELYEDARTVKGGDTKYNCGEEDSMIGKDILLKCQQNEFSKDFNEEFNKFYDENYTKSSDKEKDDWFYKTEEIQNHFHDNTLGKEEMILQIKNDQKTRRNEMSTDIIQHKTIQSIGSGFSGADIFDSTPQIGYISCANSNDLMYEDIRRVHRDETVFMVDQCDFNKDSQITMEKMIQDREDLHIEPISESNFNTSFNDAFDKTEAFRRDLYNRQKFENMKESKVNTNIFQSFISRFMNLT